MQRVLAGIAGGILGAAVFGVVLQATDSITMLGDLVNWEAAYIGWIVHLAIGAILGLVYALTLGVAVRGWVSGAITGLLYGAIAWVVGWLLVLPPLLDMPVFEVDDQALTALGGHLLYGLVLGLVLGAALMPQPEASRA